MRIVSKFKDYYDGGMSSGIDMETPYIRETKRLSATYNAETKKYEASADYELFRKFYDKIFKGRTWFESESGPSLSEYEGKDYVIKPFLIGFTGKWYIGYRIGKKDKLSSSVSSYDITYDHDLVDRIMTEDRKKVKYFSTGKYGPHTKLNAKFHGSEHRQIFDELRIPIIIYDPYFEGYQNVLFLNGKLENYGFYKIFPTIEAFQEIYMFISNLARPEPQMIKTSDIDLLQSKGFDKKTSFRKEKQNKK